MTASQYEYQTRTIRDHAQGGKIHGWSDYDHETAMLDEMGSKGWIMCAIKPTISSDTHSHIDVFYFYRKVSEC